MTRIGIFTLIGLLGFLSASGCNLLQVEATSIATSPPITAAHIDPLPAAERTLNPIEQPPTQTSSTPEPCQTDGEYPRTRHIVVADIHYPSHSVGVLQRVFFTNYTGTELASLVFNVEPNRLAGAFHLNAIESGQSGLTYAFNRQRLEVTLPETLHPGCEVVVTLSYRLEVPAVGEGASASRGFFGYTERQFNLGHWLASVAVFAAEEWITRDASAIGEQDVLERADWEVAVNLIDPPPNLTIAAPGFVSQINGNTWRYAHENSRDFSMSLSDKFLMLSAEPAPGVMVELYTFPNAHKNNAADHALAMATRSLLMFSDLFGDYPYDRLLIVQGDFPDGMELSGLVFVGNRWFQQYTGDPASYLTLITVHEISHQWWYARVGNDSALTPWLDEALATYSEYIFLEEYYPDLKDWWWLFRVDQYTPTGSVDSTVYQFGYVRDYINAVYLRGARMMHQLREDLGREAFFQFLADYAEAGTGKIATPELFWSLLSPGQLEQTQPTRDEYFQQPLVESGNG